MNGVRSSRQMAGRRAPEERKRICPTQSEFGLGYSFAYSSRTNRQTNSKGLFCPCPTVIAEQARSLTPHTPQATCKGSGSKGLTVGQGQNKKQREWEIGLIWLSGWLLKKEVGGCRHS